MKKVIILCLLSTLLKAQTSIPGGSVYGVWTLAGSPYLIQNAIMVPNDSTLTIQPGVQVIFQGYNKFLILGRLLAIGTAADSISFTCANASTGWLGIHFDNTTNNNDTSKLFFCTVEYATNSNSNGSAIYFNNFSKGLISNSRISHNQFTGSGQSSAIVCGHNAPLVRFNYISDNNCGGINTSGVTEHNLIAGNQGTGITGFQNAIIRYNTILNNIGGGVESSVGLVTVSHNFIDGNGSTTTLPGWGSGIWTGSGGIPRIDHNIIINNIGSTAGGVFGQWCDTLYLTNNIICNNFSSGNGGGVLCAKYIAMNNNLVANNTARHGGGIYHLGLYSGNNFVNNTIVNNHASKGGGMFFTSSMSNTVTVVNSVIWGNTTDTSGDQVYIDTQTSKPDFSYSDVEGGSATFGTSANIFYLGNYTNNLNASPFFVNPSAGSGTGFNGNTADWSLQNVSPCINAGSVGSYPATDLAGNTRVYGPKIDMGAYEYQGPADIANYANTNLFDAFPNPASDQLHISAQNTLGAIRICNSLGEAVIQVSSPSNTTAIDLRNLPAGVYTVYAAGSVKKLIKE